MARPQRNTVDYFPFDCQEGKKMFYLEETYGNDGFAVFVKLLRELAKTDFHFLDLSEKSTTMFLSAKCKVNVNILENIINDLVELKKFNRMLWEENRVIWCQDFVDSIQDAYNKRSNECITFDGLVSHLISLRVRKPDKGTSKGPVKPQTILKESKEKEIIIIDKILNKPFLQNLQSYLKGEFFNFTFEELEKEAQSFHNQILVTGDIHKTFPEYANHFTNKLKKLKEKQKGNPPDKLLPQNKPLD